jgi:hypothetical protein
MVDIARLNTLKLQLLQATDFMKVFEYFMTHFGENLQFMAMGKRTRHAVIEAAVAQTFQRLYGQPLPAGQLLLTLLPKQHFVHGGGFYGEKLVNVLYFDDLQMGLLAVATPFGASDIKLARFTGITVSPTESP